MGMILLAILLILFGLSRLVPIPYSDPVVGVLALVTGILLLVGRDHVA